CEDVACGPGPDEGLWIAVMFIEVAVDGGLQIDDGAEDPSSQALAGQSGEEIFDRVEPGAGGRGEMEGPARMADEPGLDLGVLVGCVMSTMAWISLPAGTARSTALRKRM